MNRKQLLDLYETTLYRIEQAEEAGTISQRDAEFSRANVYQEYTGALAEIEGLANFNEEEEEDEIEEVEAGNELGDFLLQLGEEKGYEDYDQFVEDLAQELDVDPSALDELINSEEDPDDEVTGYILGGLGLLEDEEEEEDYEEDESEDEEETENYSRAVSNAEFRLAQLENKVGQQELENKVTDALFRREAIAREMVENEALPPVVYNMLFGIQEGANVAAEFSAVAAKNGVDEATALYGIDQVLNVFSLVPFSEMGLFSDYIEDAAEFSSDENYADSAEEEQALRNVQYRLGL